VLKGDDFLLDLDTGNWAEWVTPVENQENALRMIRSCTAVRRSQFSDYLVLGQMRRPLAAFASDRHCWTDLRSGRQDLACVFQSVWERRQGGTAAALANWRDTPQTVTLSDPRFTAGQRLQLWSALDSLESRTVSARDGKLTVTLPPLCCCMLTAE
jgi:hypothetical protein